MNEQHDQLEALLNQALEFKRTERAAFLAGACGNDHDLRQKVETLLRAADEAEGFMEGITTLEPSPVSEGPGTVIGRYKLLQKIGEGGMGVVYLAEQEEPVRRRVALKIIKLGMDTRQVVARFEAERQALALMDHPNIARVLDAGATESGRPYFVMELVQGVPITEYCDKAKLPAKERLRLFIQVCHAVQSAHQKGIIHRDLKPSNILVTLHHGDPMPKVIDFGIAKATNQKLTEKTLFTQHATMIGTPAYMSPEQAELSSLDVDTRTDIYSLGVLLYELLTGSTPFPEKRLRSLGYGEMQRVIADEEPERPSTRLSTMAHEQKSAVAHNRSEDLAELGRQLRGDLDWVVMRCLEKDRRRRYETANGLAADVQRHLSNEPVVARPPSAAYRFQKAWRRNKLVFSGVGAVGLALILGIIGTSVGFVEARRGNKAAWHARWAAERSEKKALEAGCLAEEQRRAAVDARERSEAETYAADISLAQRTLETYNVGQTRELLRRHIPAAGQPDRRGWEWRYLWQKSRGDAPRKLFTETNGAALAAPSRDGRWLAVAAFPKGEISVLDIANPQAPRVIGKSDWNGVPVLGALAFSPTASLLAWASYETWEGTNDLQVRLWGFLNQTNVRTLRFESLCSDLAFSPDGKRLLTRTLKRERTPSELILWNCDDATMLARHTTLGGRLPGLAVTPDFGVAIYPGRSNTIHALDLATGAERRIATLPNPDFKLETLTISPDGRWLATSERNRDVVLRLWDVATGRELASQASGHADSINSLLFLPDGRTLVSAAEDQTIRLWDVSESGGIRLRGRPLLGRGGSVIAVAAMPDGRSFISSSADGSVYLWDSTAERREDTDIVLSGVTSFEFSADSQSLITIEQTNRVMRRQGRDFGSATHVLDLPVDVRPDMWISPDGFVVAATAAGVLQLYDLQERRLVREFGHYGGPVNLRGLSAGKKRLLMMELTGQRFHEWDLETFQSKPLGRGGDLLRESFCLSTDGEWLLGTDFNGNCSLTERKSGASRTQALGIGQVIGGIFSSDGRLFAAGSFMGYASVWETASFRPVATVGWRHLSEAVGGFSPDGTRLLTFAYNGRGFTRLWDLETSRELLSLPGSGGGFSPDGNILGQLGYAPDTAYIRRAPTMTEIEKAEAAAGKPQSP